MSVRYVQRTAHKVIECNNTRKFSSLVDCGNFGFGKYLMRAFSSNGYSDPALHVESLRGLLSDGGKVITDITAIGAYNLDWMRQYKGSSEVLIQPRSTYEVSKILEYCNLNRLPIVPQSGNTGLVGGSIPISNEIILSMAKLDDVISFDSTNGILTCESGCILQDLDEYLSQYLYMMPYDIGAKGSCMIGGNVSTNAGGQHFYRFGSMHANILGMEVVLADGTVLDLLNRNRKDNTGYDLKHLFIGAEGTLGVITKINISCPRRPRAQNVALLGCDNYDAVQNILLLAKEELGEILSAFELMDQTVLNAVGRNIDIPVKFRDGQSFPFTILVETQGSNHEHDSRKIEELLEKGMESGDIVDGVLAQDRKQIGHMWEIRESCNPTMGSIGYTYKYDVSIPISDFHDIVLRMKDRLSHHSNIIVTSWGHVIDGNLHLNVTTPNVREKESDILGLIEPFIFETVVQRGGSISAEHGLGQSKNNYLKLMKDDASVSIMRKLKTEFDPNNILNPGKFLPAL
eukprot:CAMPEP_0196804076 /NCGR_PEP_ID=MMETSP1362-20130617/3603_1 /TAXON_ID=163516 /ORGANISM="Leptocylindrus danicus, Strain CCMP1856" /LENGTH=515 /DNA_ID=CAMNT_0042176097 /DNA_START=190 /DNA_END=1737 /DNA_ORIENTATION=+